MASSLNRNNLNNDSISGIVSNDKFGELSEEMQKQILATLKENNQMDGGWMGKFFGSKKEIASMNIAVTICMLLLFMCIIEVIHSTYTGTKINMELISTIIPVVSLALGFIFGKGGGKQ